MECQMLCCLTLLFMVSGQTMTPHCVHPLVMGVVLLLCILGEGV